MKNKPIKFIIPQIHNLNDCWFIQWRGNEYYIQKNKLKIVANKIFNKYSLINFLLLISIMIISNIFPVKNFEDFFRMILISSITGMLSGIAIIEDRGNSNR